MKTKILQHYGNEFNTRSAEIILPYLKSFYDFQSVVDIGCGIGTWLTVCKSIGIKDLLGIDGSHVPDLNQFILPNEYFLKCDFDSQIKQLTLNKKYDLAICLEVAEHLKQDNAIDFVKFLVSSSDIILFSAAIPGQTGENHKNEKFPDYWVDIFKQHNYIFLDPFREKFWKNEKIEWWYRQNMFLVVNNLSQNKFDNIKKWDGNIYIIPNLLQIYSSKEKS